MEMNKTIYRPPPLLGNGHVQTIFPVLFRTVREVVYTRERISTWDSDFLDLDWSCRGSDRLAVISRGPGGKYRHGEYDIPVLNPKPSNPGDIMKQTITDITFEEEFRICPVCGYQDGFHSMLKQKKDHIQWLFICPSCHEIFDIGHRLDRL